MVLNGIGGNSIAQAQETLSYVEFKKWLAYRRKRGSLNLGMRFEMSIAQFTAIWANANTKGGGYTPYDFAPHHDEPPETIENAMKSWS